MVLLPTVFIAALEKNTYLLFKNSFNLHHHVCMTESFWNISVYAETKMAFNPPSMCTSIYLYCPLCFISMPQQFQKQSPCHGVQWQENLYKNILSYNKQKHWSKLNTQDRAAIGATIARCQESHSTRRHLPPQQATAAHSWSIIGFNLITAPGFSFPWNKLSCPLVA